jgi:catechol-2,3-dioxygenase
MSAFRLGLAAKRGAAMELHLGRLIDHVHIRVADVARSKAFYRAALAP